jgi:UDP-glucose 4-epimerase
VRKLSILVTGPSGFVASEFIKSYGDIFNIVSCSLREKDPFQIDFKGIDAVLHLAAIVHQMKSRAEKEYFEVNTDLTQRLALAAKMGGVKHFVFFSSVKVYGSDGNLDDHLEVFGADSPCQPMDAYGRSKLAAEVALKSLVDNEFKLCIVRSPLIYAAHAKGNLQNLKALISKCRVLPFGYYSNRRSWVTLNNLLMQISHILSSRYSGLVIPQEAVANSLGEIVEFLSKELGVKVYLITPPELLIKLLRLFAPKYVIRLFGSLAFDQRLNFKNFH